jgi:hypothetical protein
MTHDLVIRRGLVMMAEIQVVKSLGLGWFPWVSEAESTRGSHT